MELKKKISQTMVAGDCSKVTVEIVDGNDFRTRRSITFTAEDIHNIIIAMEMKKTSQNN